VTSSVPCRPSIDQLSGLPLPNTCETITESRGRLRRRFAVHLLVPMAVFVALVLPRLMWGLPSAERARYYPDDPSIMNGLQTHDRLYMTSPIESLHPDEGLILNALAHMRPDRGDFNPHFFQYPSFHIYTTGALLRLLQMAGVVQLQNDKAFYFRHPSEMAKIYRAGRSLSVLYGALGILLVALITYELTSDVSAAGVAALILAIVPFWIRDSAFMKLDVPSGTIDAAVVYLSIRGYRRLSSKYLLLAAAVAGIAAGTKYNAAAMLALPLLLGLRVPNGLSGWRLMTAQVLVALLAFFVTTPYAILAPGEFLDGIVSTAMWQWPTQSQSLAVRMSPWLVIRTWSGLVFVTGAALAAAGGVSWIFVARRRPRVAALVALWFVLASLSAIISPHNVIRYWLPGMPALAATVAVAYWFGRQRFNVALMRTALASVVGATAISALDVNVSGLTQQDPRTEAAAWIERNIPHGSRVATRRMYYDRPTVDDSKYHVVQLDFDRCETEMGVWHVTAERFGTRPACEATKATAAVFSNALRFTPLLPMSQIPEDLYLTNLRIVIYQPRVEPSASRRAERRLPSTPARLSEMPWN
jgi:hypothetical protein